MSLRFRKACGFVLMHFFPPEEARKIASLKGLIWVAEVGVAIVGMFSWVSSWSFAILASSISSSSYVACSRVALGRNTLDLKYIKFGSAMIACYLLLLGSKLI